MTDGLRAVLLAACALFFTFAALTCLSPRGDPRFMEGNLMLAGVAAVAAAAAVILTSV